MKLTIISFLLLVSIGLKAQDGVVLDANKTSIYISNTGTNFYNGNTAEYVVPKGELVGKSTIYSCGLWLSALDDNNELYVAANTYGLSSGDYQAGLINADGLINYDKIYVVTLEEIEEHILRPGRTTGDIISWPGNGDTTKGEPWQLAPFVDVNENGVYEPKLGEYPRIRGEKAAYCIYTDNKLHESSGSKPMNIEIHQMFYQYNESETLLDETNLAHYRLINRSDINYKDFRLAFFVDFDLGNFIDDYVGCDTFQNMIFAINGDDNDEGELGYGLNPPSQGLVFLNHKLSSAVYYNNNTNPINGNPSKAIHYANYMRGRFMNGAEIMHEGPDGPKETKYMFADDPNDKSSWYNNSSSASADRRMLGTIGPYDLAAGASICVDVAYVYGRSKLYGALGSFNVMKYRTSEVQYAYNQNFFGGQDELCLGGNGLASIKYLEVNTSFSIYPNPTSSMLHIKTDQQDIEWTVYSVHGVEVGRFTGKTYDVSHLSPGMYVLRSYVGVGRFVRAEQ